MVSSNSSSSSSSSDDEREAEVEQEHDDEEQPDEEDQELDDEEQPGEEDQEVDDEEHPGEEDQEVDDEEQACDSWIEDAEAFEDALPDEDPEAEGDEVEEDPRNDDQAANNRPARGGARGGRSRARSRGGARGGRSRGGARGGGRSGGPPRTPGRTTEVRSGGLPRTPGKTAEVRSGGTPRTPGRTTEASGKSLTVVVAVKESLQALRWTIENIIRQSEASRRQAGAAWPWSSNTSPKKLVAVHSTHVLPVVKYFLSNNYVKKAHQCVTAGGASVREEVEKTLSYSPTGESVKIECRKQGVQVKIVETNGDPRLKLFNVVEQQKADILVLGGHNYSDIRKLFLGSVADTFVDYCRSRILKCHLVVVHRKNGRGRPFISVHSPS